MAGPASGEVWTACNDDLAVATVLLIIQLTGTLGVDVVAEGVDTEERAELLASMSCSHAQGYHFARLMPAEEVTAMLGGRFSWGRWQGEWADDARTVHLPSPRPCAGVQPSRVLTVLEDVG